MIKRRSEMYDVTIEMLADRGVELIDIARLVTDLQKKYRHEITDEISMKYIEKVLLKREVQHTVMTGIQLDVLAEQGKMVQPLQDIVATDEGLFGSDESLAMAIVNVYGSIGLTNFGYIDKVKPGIVGELDGNKNGMVHTFLDDIVGAIAAAAASSFAHNNPNKSEALF